MATSSWRTPSRGLWREYPSSSDAAGKPRCASLLILYISTHAFHVYTIPFIPSSISNAPFDSDTMCETILAVAHRSPTFLEQ